VIEGRVKHLNRINRTAVVETSDGREVALHFGAESYIEVPELASGGFITGSFEYLKEGYWVEAKFTESDGACHCSSLCCRS